MSESLNFMQYGEHLDGCEIWRASDKDGYEHDCDCGFTALYRAAEAVHGEQLHIEEVRCPSPTEVTEGMVERVLRESVDDDESPVKAAADAFYARINTWTPGRDRIHALSRLIATCARAALSVPRAPEGEAVKRPEIVCLCGSTRFMEAFFDEGWRLTLEGKIVLSVGVVKTANADGHAAEALGQDVADRLDDLHLRKIDLADSVLVLNVGGYVGNSTRREIEYAQRIGKPVAYLESVPRALTQETTK